MKAPRAQVLLSTVVQGEDKTRRPAPRRQRSHEALRDRITSKG
jgi:hypothetical protein